MRETRNTRRETSQETSKTAPGAATLVALSKTCEWNKGDLSFDALMKDDLVRLVMASDHVSEGEIQALKGVRPLIHEAV